MDYQELTKYCSFSPSSKLKEAYTFSLEHHKDRKRYSGHDHIVHPVSVAIELAKLHLDEPTVIAGLLHDIIEICGVSEEELKDKFGQTVSDLIVAETKVDEMTSESHLKFSDYEPLKKLLMSITKDIRVLLIRLADRLDNMRTVQYLKPERQITYAEETLNFYVPIAEYIGMGSWKREMEDISFRIIEPEKYAKVAELIKRDPRPLEFNIEVIKKDLEELLKANNIKAEVTGRIKSVSSTYKKLERKIKAGEIQNYDLSVIKDILAFSVIAKSNDVISCYKILGLIHGKWSFSQVDFTDYISNPKPNGYRSIHTIIKYEGDEEIEVQIKTKQIHEFNEFGPASHIAYKLAENKNATPNRLFGWIKSLVRWKDESLKNYQLDIFKNKIYVFTPMGKVIELPKDSTPVDFAFHVHTKIGNSCRGAKVNDKISTLDTKLKTGDIVEIITDKKALYPNKEWLNFVKSPTAKASIKRSLNEQMAEELLLKGKDAISEKAKFKYDLNWLKLSTDQIEKIEATLNSSLNTIYRRVAAQPSEAFRILTELEPILKIKPIERIRKVTTKSSIDSKITFVDGHTYQYRLAKCCNPTTNDEIVGYLSIGFGVAIHSKKCKEVPLKNVDQKVNVKWS